MVGLRSVGHGRLMLEASARVKKVAKSSRFEPRLRSATTRAPPPHEASVRIRGKILALSQNG